MLQWWKQVIKGFFNFHHFEFGIGLNLRQWKKSCYLLMTEQRQHNLLSFFESRVLTRPCIEPMPTVHKPGTWAIELFSLYGLYLGNVKITWLQFVVPWWTCQGVDAQQGRTVESIDILQNRPGWTGRWRRRYCQVVIWAVGYEPGTLQNERESTLRPHHQIHSAFFLLRLKSLIQGLKSPLQDK